MFGVLSLSDQAGTAALSLYLFGHGGTGALSWLAVRFFPPAAAGLLVPAVLKRVGVARALTRVPMWRAGLLLGCAAAAHAGIGTGWVLALLGLDMAVAQGYRPAVATALPRLSESVEGLTRASATFANAKSVGGFTGATVGALLGVTVGLDATCLLIALPILAGIPAVARTTRSDDLSGPVRLQPLLKALPAMRSRAAGVSLTVGAMRTLLRGAWSGLAVVLATRVLGMGTDGVWVLALAAGAGGLASLTVTGRLLAGHRLASWLCLSITVAAAATEVLPAYPSGSLAVVEIFVWGLALAVADLSASTVIPRVVDHRNAAAVSAVNENAKLVLEGLGAFGAPLLAGILGPRIALATFSEIVLVVMAVGWPIAVRAERDVAQRMRTLALLRSTKLFRPLRLDAVETLAAGCRGVSCPAGQTLFAAGDAGDTYWVLHSGTVEVHPPGRPPLTLGPGQGFGEIAMLHSVPRTATVLVAEDIEALVIDRDSFLLALTGAPETTQIDPAPVVGTDPRELVRAAPSVARLGSEHAARVADSTPLLQFPSGAVICRAGDAADCIWVVVSGRVRVDAPGRDLLLSAGAEFGAIGLLTGHRTADVIAVEDCRLAQVPAARLLPGASRRP